MPTYEYACKECSEHLEVVQSFKDDPLTECPSCHGQLRKVFSAAGLIFKGSGWHIKDYSSTARSSGSAASGESTGDGAGSSGESSDGKSSDGKSSDGKSSDGKSSDGKTETVSKAAKDDTASADGKGSGRSGDSAGSAKRAPATSKTTSAEKKSA